MTIILSPLRRHGGARLALKAIVLGAAMSASVFANAPAFAQDAEEIAAIRAEMDAMRSEYEARMNALEERLRKAEGETRAASGPAAPVASSGPQAPVASLGPQPAVSGPAPAAPAPVAAATTAPAPAEGRSAVAANSYNPGIAVVLNGGYGAFENDPDAAVIPGFALGDEAGLEPRGFTLGESEIAMFANIDHRLYGNLIFSLNDEGEVEVEEAYVQSTSLPGGFVLKAGKFLSGVSYLNEKHAHAQDFIDTPLPYRVFLGGALGDAGVQARWLAPTDFYLEAGAEIMRGDSFPAGGAANKGAGAYAGYVQTGGDIGISSSWLAKVSYLHTKANERETGDGDIFTGNSDLGIFSLVYKWAPNGNPTRQNLIVSGEYFLGKDTGLFNDVAIDLTRRGWYGQAVYQFVPNWRVGLRYAQLGSEAVPDPLSASTIDVLGRSPRALSALLEYDTSEFSRFRIMYTLDDSDLMTNNELLLRYTVTFGPHGGHRF